MFPDQIYCAPPAFLPEHPIECVTTETLCWKKFNRHRQTKRALTLNHLSIPVPARSECSRGDWVLGYWAVQWSWFARLNALRNLSRKMSRDVAAPLPGRFLCRHFFTLCIAREVEPRIAKQYIMPPLLQLQKLPEKGDGGWEENVSASFLGWPKDREFVHTHTQKMHFGASYSTSNKILLVARHIQTTGLLKCL